MELGLNGRLRVARSRLDGFECRRDAANKSLQFTGRRYGRLSGHVGPLPGLFLYPSRRERRIQLARALPDSESFAGHQPLHGWCNVDSFQANVLEPLTDGDFDVDTRNEKRVNVISQRCETRWHAPWRFVSNVQLRTSVRVHARPDASKPANHREHQL